MIVYRSIFGSWNAALEVSGLIPNQRRSTKRVRQQLIADLKRLAKELGQTPASKHASAASKAGECASVSTYTKAFGSWNAALEAAGFAPIRIYRTKQQLVDDLRKLAKELGRTPKRREIDASARKVKFAYSTAYTKAFGSWNAAIKAAGLKPNRDRKKKKAVRS